jgi:hypothetical protein
MGTCANTGSRRAERLVEQDLLRRVRDVVVAADDVRDAHGDIVAHHGEVVDRRAVGAQDDEILDVGIVEADRVPCTASSQRCAVGHAEADGVRLAGGRPARGSFRSMTAQRRS